MGWRFCDSPTGISTGTSVMCVNKLILSFEKGYKTLSVTCGDSSPKGRAKTLSVTCGDSSPKGRAKALSVTCGDSSPKGRAKGLAPLYIVCWHEKWSVSVLRRSIDCFMNTHLSVGVIYCLPVLITQGFRPSFHLAGAGPSASALWGQRPKACRLRGASRLCARGRLV